MYQIYLQLLHQTILLQRCLCLCMWSVDRNID